MTFISIYIFEHIDRPQYSNARLVVNSENRELDLHIDIPCEKAREEMDKLAALTGRAPEVMDESDGTGIILRSLTACLN